LGPDFGRKAFQKLPSLFRVGLLEGR